MRRIALIGTSFAAAAVLVAAGPAAGGDGGPYEVRAFFDNASFLVTGEEVRIAGARVGAVTEVDVSREDEIVSLEDGEQAMPGKAAVVLTIDDPAFQDFREDASCLIRPQSLLGEKFVECLPTQPRAAGTEPPPELEEIPDGQPGEGQRLLPIENNGKSVDLDLVQNIQRLPYAERFRIILNELGAGLAARGEELAEIVERGNPALRQANRVLEILAEQNRELAQLAEDGDRVLAPLARQRERVGGFIENAGETAEAAAERRADLAAGFERLPAGLRELRLTMPVLERFNERAEPTITTLGDAAGPITRATVALGPFSRAATTSLTSLGDAAEATGPKLRRADPIIRDVRDLGRVSKPAAVNLRALLRTMRKTQGFESLMDFLFFSVGATNGFDRYGHFLRAVLTNNNCNYYEIQPIAGCSANFETTGTAAAASSASVADLLSLSRQGARAERARERGTVAEEPERQAGSPLEALDGGGELGVPAEPGTGLAPVEPVDPGEGVSPPPPDASGSELGSAGSRRTARALARFLMEDGP